MDALDGWYDDSDTPLTATPFVPDACRVETSPKGKKWLVWLNGGAVHGSTGKPETQRK